ncbi:MAG: hypothetical protein QOG91_683, partial [Candidatus Parcubacteria bacterium]|nr:hypothetical protein [Candidatus Parcubacteria bacterium]
MKSRIFAGFLVLAAISFLPHAAHAAVKFWIGPGGGSFSNNLYWSTSSGGANNTTAPGAGDIATFDSGDNNNAAIDGVLSVGGIDIKSTYGGAITQSAALTVGASNFSMAGGNITVTSAAAAT